MDILFKTEDRVFSYRVAGICVQNGMVLLQKPANDSAYAFPGGHVAFGETNAETLIRGVQGGNRCGYRRRKAEMGRGDFLPLGRQTLSPDLSLLHGGYYESRNSPGGDVPCQGAT